LGLDILRAQFPHLPPGIFARLPSTDDPAAGLRRGQRAVLEPYFAAGAGAGGLSISDWAGLGAGEGGADCAAGAHLRLPDGSGAAHAIFCRLCWSDHLARSFAGARARKRSGGGMKIACITTSQIPSSTANSIQVMKVAQSL